MIPTSASSFNSSLNSICCPSSPCSARRENLLVDVVKCVFPLPPRPPLATGTRCPSFVKSKRRVSPFAICQTSVPSGTITSMSFPSRPCFFRPSPRVPPAATCLRLRRKRLNVLRPASHLRKTDPPLPPSPPSGPPSGTNFSLRPLTAPFPPLPLITDIRALSSIISYFWKYISNSL